MKRLLVVASLLCSSPAFAGSAVQAQFADLVQSSAGGWVPVTKLAQGLMTAGQKVAPQSIDADPGSCVLVLGVSGRGTTVDLAIFDQTNAKIGSKAGEIVNFEACSPQGGRLRFEATSTGSGEIAAQVFAKLDYSQDLQAQAIEALVQSTEPGAQRVSHFHSSTDIQVDWNDFQLEAGHCYTFAGAADGTLKGLALYLSGPDRKGISNIKSKKKPEAALSYCAAMSGPHQIRVKTIGLFTSGRYRVALYDKAGGAVPATKFKPVQEAPPQKMRDVLGEMLEEKAKVAARGMTIVGAPQDGAGSQGGMMDFEVQLDAGKCYTLVGVGTAGIRELSLYLWDPAKKRVADRKARESSAALGHCAKTDGPFHVQAKVHDGAGQFRLGLYVK